MNPVQMPVLNKAVVAGGGPVGALAAIALASQGWDVQVLVRRYKPIRYAEMKLVTLVQAGVREVGYAQRRTQVHRYTRISVEPDSTITTSVQAVRSRCHSTCCTSQRQAW